MEGLLRGDHDLDGAVEEARGYGDLTPPGGRVASACEFRARACWWRRTATACAPVEYR
jgi:hypothetical protein